MNIELMYKATVTTYGKISQYIGKTAYKLRESIANNDHSSLKKFY